jgi:hypothetical protein
MVPAPFACSLAVDKSFTSVQEVPFQDSVFAVIGGVFPAKANVSVEVFDDADMFDLAVFKSPTSVQEVPFQDSFAADTEPVFPPTAKAAVVVPTPARVDLAVFKSPTSVHADPFQLSVLHLLQVIAILQNIKLQFEFQHSIESLAVFKSAISVQVVPFQDSVFATYRSCNHQFHNSSSLCSLPDNTSDLAVFKSCTSVQVEPL